MGLGQTADPQMIVFLVIDATPAISQYPDGLTGNVLILLPPPLDSQTLHADVDPHRRCLCCTHPARICVPLVSPEPPHPLLPTKCATDFINDRGFVSGGKTGACLSGGAADRQTRRGLTASSALVRACRPNWVDW